jgi:hypothetical protein
VCLVPVAVVEALDSKDGAVVGGDVKEGVDPKEKLDVVD